MKLLIEVSAEWTKQERLGVAARLADLLSEQAASNRPDRARMDLAAKWIGMVARSSPAYLNAERARLLKLVGDGSDE